jgi:hypothetical protein
VFILKIVKVFCFDTLLQVLILKGVVGEIIEALRLEEISCLQRAAN